MNLTVLSLLGAALLVLGAGFQAGLAFGAPWGAAAYGGRAASDKGTLAGRYRLGSAVATLVLLAAMWVMLAAGSVVDRGPVSGRALTVALWILTAVFALNTLGNARGRHPVERWGAGGVTALLTILCALLAAR